MPTSTNALTARYCASLGWRCETVQRFYGGRRHDLFGIADSVAMNGADLLLLQNCSYGTLKAHRDAITKNDALFALDGIVGVSIGLWEWRKKKAGRRSLWFLRTQWREFGAWQDPGEWTGPFDIYPTKKRDKAR